MARLLTSARMRTVLGFLLNMRERAKSYQNDFLIAPVDFTSYLRVLEHLPKLESSGLRLRRKSGEYSKAIQEFWQDVQFLIRQIDDPIEEVRSRRALLFGKRQPDLFKLVMRCREPGVLESAPLGKVLLYLRGVTGFERFGEGFFAEEFSHGGVLRALHRLQTLCTCSPEHVDEILRFKRIFDELTIQQLYYWNDWERIRLPEGGEALHVPYPTYHPAIWEWNTAVFCTPFYIDPYREVEGEESGVAPPRFIQLGAPGRPNPEEFFKNRPLEEVRQYMAVGLRGEKWCDGNIASEFRRGVAQAAFRRLEVLRAEMGGR